MPFQLSPGVNITEIDLTTIVPAVGTTEGAFVGNFNWGPIDEVRTISSELELVNTFGKPDDNTFVDFFTAANFLAYARNLKLVRASNDSTAKNASMGNGILIKNENDYSSNYINMEAANTAGMFAARYPGTLGNSLKVSMYADTDYVARDDWNSTTWTYAEFFDSAPNTSVYAAGVGGRNDELHLIVIDEDGKFSGTANTVLERFSYLSKASDAKTSDGSSNYYVNVINDRSQYIYIINHPLDPSSNVADSTNWGNPASATTYSQGAAEYTKSLSGGVNGTVTDANRITAYDKFKNGEEIDISLVMTGAANTTVVQHCIDNLAEYRKDCVVFCSPERSDVVSTGGSEAANNIIDTRNSIGRSTSYAVMDSSWKYQFDKYNNVYRWVPMNGDIAGLCVRTDFERDPWFSPAGFTRGQIKNVVRLAYNPDKTDRDELYKNGINPIVTFRGEGTLLYGDKTMLSRPSAFDRINVRRLFIVLEKAIARAAKYSLFEFNDEFTRGQFVALVEPYLRDVKGRRGIYDFRVVCDETNNTPEVIDRNEFVGDIYIKPARSINFIQLNFIAVRTGVAFEEIVGNF
jgi:Phage tail sheath protein subtilisin-like domain/Phage tail sheath C-terminal domain